MQIISLNEESGPLRVYQARPRAMNKDGVIPVIAGGEKGLGRVMVEVPGYASIPADTRVTITVEVYMGQNKRHPIPYARQPEPGPFNDWGDMNRIDEAGKWLSHWLQAAELYEPLSWNDDGEESLNPTAKKALPHTTKLYQRIRCLYDTLLQVEYNPNQELFPWIKRGPPVSIKQIEYDHLAQTITFNDQIPVRKNVPTLVSFLKNEAELHRMYKKNIKDSSLVVGDRPSSGLAAPGQEVKRCALCFTLRNVPGSFKAGEKFASENGCPSMPKVDFGQQDEPREASCKLCYLLRGPCVWVPISDLENTFGQFRFIKSVPKNQGGTMTIFEEWSAGLEEGEEGEDVVAELVR